MTPRNSSLSSDDPRERAFDALDHANDERKERRHDQRQAIPVLRDVEAPARIVAVELMSAFDRISQIDNAQLTIFERDTPGIEATLRAWAASHGLPIDYHPVQDWPGCFVTRVTTKGGADITVHTGQHTGTHADTCKSMATAVTIPATTEGLP